MRILVTAGPTREYIDSVRFISNGSSGLMGKAIASVGVKRGHDVFLISGPVDLEIPKGIECVRVISAREMYKAVLEHYNWADVVVMTAAVSDYRPVSTSRYKMKKGQERLTLELVRNPDILAELGRRKKRQILIGFALEDRNARRNALRKFMDKQLDAIVLNGPDAIASYTDRVQIYTAEDGWVELAEMSKRLLSRRIIDLAERLFKRRADE